MTMVKVHLFLQAALMLEDRQRANGLNRGHRGAINTSRDDCSAVELAKELDGAKQNFPSDNVFSTDTIICEIFSQSEPTVEFLSRV